MSAKKALFLIAAGAAIYWAYKVNSEDKPDWFDSFSPQTDLLKPITDAINSGWGFVKTGVENIYGETFGYWEMDLSPSMIEFIKRHEGVKYKAYEAKGRGKGDWTIGVGHKILKGEEYLLKATLTEVQVNDLLKKDLYAPASTGREGAVMTVRRLFKGELSQPQFDAAVSFVFNFGASHANTRTLAALVNAGKYEDAANFIQGAGSSQWAALAGLKERRLQEAEMFRAGSLD